MRRIGRINADVLPVVETLAYGSYRMSDLCQTLSAKGVIVGVDVDAKTLRSILRDSREWSNNGIHGRGSVWAKKKAPVKVAEDSVSMSDVYNVLMSVQQKLSMLLNHCGI